MNPFRNAVSTFLRNSHIFFEFFFSQALRGFLTRSIPTLLLQLGLKTDIYGDF